MLQKKLRIEIWTFSFQIGFQIQFLTLVSSQTENTQIHIFAYFQFQFKKVKIGFPILFSKRDVALAGVNCGDRLWFLQSCWSIFYRKITGYF